MLQESRENGIHLLKDAIECLENPQRTEVPIEGMAKERKEYLNKALGFFHGKSKSEGEKENLFLAVKLCKMEILILETINTSVKPLIQKLQGRSNAYTRARAEVEIHLITSPILRKHPKEAQSINEERMRRNLTDLLFANITATTSH